MVEVGVLFVSQLDPDTVLVQVTDGHVTCMRPPPLVVVRISRCLRRDGGPHGA